MPESKNSFVGGKMNSDLDDRLLSKDEYRSAQNINVSRSDSSDSGVAKNVLGNTNMTSRALGSSYKVIGSVVDDSNNRVFTFLTNNASDHRVSVYDANAETITDIVTGSFLNFSTSFLITGVDVLEDFLIWTDNNNQPRRINITKAISDPTFYNSEIKISLAKYAPVYAPKITAAVNDTSITSEVIKENFVRFAYRYKFEDNEYSILSPFTSIAFKMTDNEIPSVSDVYSSTELAIMVNGVNKITMKIPMPSSSPYTTHQIKEVDIIYKESNNPAVLVADTVSTVSVTTVDIDANNDGVADEPTIEYIYKSTRPKYTLPESQLTRVYDNVPVKAKAQAVAGNRLIYGNFTQGYDAPSLDYTVSVSAKSSIIVSNNPILEDHNVKSRRQYQVGVVLSDMYGRSTPVILSPTSSIYVGAKSSDFVNAGWLGDSLKISFNGVIPNAYNASTNPLGWYSYKIVVKQLEQEYYNVYTAGVIGVDYLPNESYIQLFGDNINKVPRDVTSSNVENDDVSPSRERLWPKVLNSENVSTISDGDIVEVLGIGTEDDFQITGLLYKMYNWSKKPLLANLSSPIGEVYYDFGPALAVFETEPFESSIQIYYETATSGYVSEINDNINDVVLEDFSINDSSLTYAIGNVPESTLVGDYIATLYAFSDATGFEEILPGNVSFTINSGDTVGGDIRYSIEVDPADGYHKIKLEKAFLYSSIDNSRTLNITASYAGVDITRNVTFNESDVVPTITGPTTGSIVNTVTAGVDTGLLFYCTAVNGASSDKLNKTDLTFSIVSATHNSVDVSGLFSVSSNFEGTSAEPGTATVYASSSIVSLSETFDLTIVVRASDSNGSTVGNDLTCVIDISGTAGVSYDEVQYYYASLSTFANASAAIATPTSGPEWTLRTLYVEVGEDPLTNVDLTEKLYAGATLNRFAPTGWYILPAVAVGKWDGAGVWISITTITT